MFVTKDIDNKVFDYIYPWGENLSSIACAIRAPYRCNIMATPGQAVFAKDLVFNLVVVVEWWVATTVRKDQVDIDNVRENDKWVTHDYAIGDLGCV